MLTLSEIKNKYGYSRSTLLRWEREGKIHPQRTAGGHRRYLKEEINNIDNVADLAQINTATAYSETKPSQQSMQYDEWGITGLRQYGGSVQEERVRELRGRNGRKIKRQMRLDDPVIAAIFLE
jgi:DNA-binding transcriptional MerR regulator